MKPNDALDSFTTAIQLQESIYTIHISMCIIFMEFPLPSNTKWIQNYLAVKIFFPSNVVQEEGDSHWCEPMKEEEKARAALLKLQAFVIPPPKPHLLPLFFFL